MITKEELRGRIQNACAAVIGAEAELTEIDSRFGDADHGFTMAKIARTISESVEEGDSIQEMLDNAGCAVMGINGGSAVPLWNTWLDGLQEYSVAEDSMTVAQVKAMYQGAYEELFDMSTAKVGDKTMMDALIPATEAIQAWDGDMDGLFEAAARAAEAGAENSKNFVSRFGRAKSYGQQTIGTPDAGAVSMKYFFAGLAKK
jgi:dihydroxyacetone kinase-like protein